MNQNPVETHNPLASRRHSRSVTMSDVLTSILGPGTAAGQGSADASNALSGHVRTPSASAPPVTPAADFAVSLQHGSNDYSPPTSSIVASTSAFTASTSLSSSDGHSEASAHDESRHGRVGSDVPFLHLPVPVVAAVVEQGTDSRAATTTDPRRRSGGLRSVVVMGPSDYTQIVSPLHSLPADVGMGALAGLRRKSILVMSNLSPSRQGESGAGADVDGALDAAPGDSMHGADDDEEDLQARFYRAAATRRVAEDRSSFIGLLFFLLFSLILCAGYGMYRGFFCDFPASFLQWQCDVKPFQRHW